MSGAGRAHAWMPVSACTAACIDAGGDRVGPAMAAARAAGILGVLAAYPAALLVGRGRREEVQRRYARAVLRCLGMRVRVVDRRKPPRDDARFATPGRGTLVVAGHVGWTDVLAIASVQPVSFVARADLAEWPVIGPIAEFTGIVPIDRARLRQLPGVVTRIGDRLAAGDCIAAFPEGTTWCGKAYGPMRPALFQAAVDSGVPVAPVALRYLRATGEPTTVAGFVGEDSLLGSAVRLLRARGVVAEVVLLPVEAPGNDRRELAARCERAVRGYRPPEPSMPAVLPAARAVEVRERPVAIAGALAPAS
ncbi:1-acyl-sn-glycerol-3-phosphate acyltransferase [Aldersonia sp. NBC_00410]|uniref:lysophospholipid acyltransferase family protein n=1 Tax=Aldersonia sp. NBC_00410 TaxID=2975954 RepID=UPI0022536B36|nr:lysophospholipid acyltransferase family protein [Aldersonia sp. NBC_00410]MCX5046095.1 1-acyl-sn-glycerol-3-phosphate acyltransferase [Aldersonia sp. NBC_00410]